jgi:hypothetical protein
MPFRHVPWYRYSTGPGGQVLRMVDLFETVQQEDVLEHRPVKWPVCAGAPFCTSLACAGGQRIAWQHRPRAPHLP